MNAILPITTARAGEHVRIHSIRTDGAQRQRLRELGVLEGKLIRVLVANDPLICEIGECRFGVARRLATGIFVETGPRAQSA